MSSAAKFLLEFEARGDQEVINKIREVGAAGEEAATGLQSLQDAGSNTEGSLSGIAGAAGEAAAPVSELGSAAGETAPLLTEVSTEAEAAGTGLEEFGTASEDAATKSESLGSSVTAITGAITAIGGAIGSTVSSLFRLRDAQLAVQQAQSRAASSAESYRKSEVAIDTVLSKATSNTAAIAAARQRLSEAQDRLNAMQREGVTSGQEYEAAVNEVNAAQTALAQAAQGTGVDMAKLTAAMESNQTNSNKMAVSLQKVEKALQNQQRTIMDVGFGFASLAGNIAQIAPKIGSLPKIFTGLKGAMEKLPFLATSAGITGRLIPALGKIGGAAVIAAAAFEVFRAVPKIFDFVAAAVEGNLKKMIDAALQYMEIAKQVSQFAPGGAAVSKLYDEVIKKLKDIAAQRKIQTDTTGQAAAAETDYIAKIRNTIKDYQNLFNTTQNGIELQSRFAGSARMSGDMLAKMGGETQEATGTVQELTDQFGEAINLQSRFTDSVRLLGPAYESAGDKIVENIQKIQDAQGTMGDFMVDVTGQITEGNQAFFESEVKNNEEITKGKEILSGYAAAMDDTINALEKGRQALRDETQELQNRLTLLQDTEAQQIMTTNAILENAIAYEEAAQRVRDLNAILQNQDAHQKAVATAVLEARAALMEESIAIDAAIASSASLVDQQLALENAYKQGALSINEYINGLVQAEAEEAGMINQLLASGAAWEDIPPFVEKNIETLQLFGIAAKRGGEAASEAAKMAADAWRNATSEMGGEISNLADILMEGGEDMDESIDKFFSDLGNKMGRNLTDVEEEAVTKLAEINEEAAEAINKWQFGQLMGESIAQSGEEVAAQFDELAGRFGGQIGEVFSRAAEIVRQNPEMAAAVNEVMQNAGKEAPHLLMQELNTLPGLMNQNAQQSAAAWGQAFTGNAVVDANAMVNNAGLNEIPPKAGEVGRGAGIALSQEFAAAGTHIAAVIEGIKANIASIGTAAGSGAIQFKITADTSDAYNKLSALHKALTAITQIKVAPTIQVNIAPAIQQLQSLKVQINAVKQTRIPPIRVNIAPGLQLVRQLQNAINSIRQTRVPRITVNASQAFSTINRVKSQLNSLKNINRTITYRYRTVGSPPRGAQTGMHETLAADTAIMAHKGERVDITPGSGHGAQVAGPLGGSRTINVSVPVFLDGKVITRVVRRHLAEDVTAGM